MDRGSRGLLVAGQDGLRAGVAAALGAARQCRDTRLARAHPALAAALAPGAPGRPSVAERLPVERLTVARPLLVLSQVAHAALRARQACLRESRGVPRNGGASAAVRQEAAARPPGDGDAAAAGPRRAR